MSPPGRPEGEFRSAPHEGARTTGLPPGRGGPDADDLVDAIDRALPQTQCTRCGFPDCRGYAEAIAHDDVAIDRCPPGGADGILRLARITGRAATPLDPAHGAEGPRRLALIDEAWCIGCTLCLKACPVDCIVGASKLMHTVVADQCTGCELCIPACPVDCISLQPVDADATGWAAWSPALADQARSRYAFHRLRLERDQSAEEARLAAATPAAGSTVEPASDGPSPAVAAALARARARRLGAGA